jgi:4'-phosphopantetheinyl transferase
MSVSWHASSLDAPAALEKHLVEVLGPGVVESGRLCPSCGSSSHGAPWARHADRSVHVSLSRSGGVLVTAVSLTSPVGVDVEAVSAVGAAWSPDLVLAPGESASTPEQRTWLWVAKEAVLKARGVGLMTPMTSVLVADEPVEPVPAPDGYVAAFAQGSTS